jgi:hypothetical protein
MWKLPAGITTNFIPIEFDRKTGWPIFLAASTWAWVGFQTCFWAADAGQINPTARAKV